MIAAVPDPSQLSCDPLVTRMRLAAWHRTLRSHRFGNLPTGPGARPAAGISGERRTTEAPLVMETLTGIVLVAVGSATGGLARFLVTDFVTGRFGEAFPWGTLLVNISGSFAIGALAAVLADLPPQQAAPLAYLLVIGGLGGYTTASAFSLQALTLLNAGLVRRAVSYVAASMILCVVAAALGYTAIAGGV